MGRFFTTKPSTTHVRSQPLSNSEGRRCPCQSICLYTTGFVTSRRAGKGPHRRCEGTLPSVGVILSMYMSSWSNVWSNARPRNPGTSFAKSEITIACIIDGSDSVVSESGADSGPFPPPGNMAAQSGRTREEQAHSCRSACYSAGTATVCGFRFWGRNVAPCLETA